MTHISDQKLEKFTSGDLPESETQEIEAMLNSDPALCARVASMSSAQTADLAKTIKAAVDSTAQGDVPAEIMDMLRPPETVVAIGAAKKSAAAPRKYLQPAAIAASLAVAAVASFLLLQPNPTGGALPGHTVTALNSMVDGTQNGETIVGESYLDADGKFCRSFLLNDTSKQTGLACKFGANWQLIALVTVPTDTAYFPAGACADGLLSQYTATMRALNDGEETRYLSK